VNRPFESAAIPLSKDDELLLVKMEGAVAPARADSDARKRGAFRVDPTDWDCWACRSEAVPAIRKLSAAMRHAMLKKLRLVFIFWRLPLFIAKFF
jgi:hypothetical protein